MKFPHLECKTISIHNTHMGGLIRPSSVGISASLARYNSRIPVDPDGALRGGRVKLDYDYEADPEGANLQLQLNKQARAGLAVHDQRGVYTG